MKNKTLFKALLSLSGIFIFAAFFIASDTPAKTQQSVTVKVANFSFTPDSTAKPKSQDLAFVLINPSYAESFHYSPYHPFNDFAKAMAQDVEQTIVARGYSIFGPYSTPDEMVYSDKKNSDIILYVDIEPEINLQNVKANQNFHSSLYGGTGYYTYSFSGSMIMSGKINLTAKAVWNQEKLWIKSIPMEQKTIEIASTKTYEVNSLVAAFQNSDPGVVNPVVDAMEQYYTSIMKLIYAHLDPEEMKDVKKQADEIKAKYQGK